MQRVALHIHKAPRNAALTWFFQGWFTLGPILFGYYSIPSIRSTCGNHYGNTLLYQTLCVFRQQSRSSALHPLKSQQDSKRRSICEIIWQNFEDFYSDLLMGSASSKQCSWKLKMEWPWEFTNHMEALKRCKFGILARVTHTWLQQPVKATFWRARSANSSWWLFITCFMLFIFLMIEFPVNLLCPQLNRFQMSYFISLPIYIYMSGN